MNEFLCEFRSYKIMENGNKLSRLLYQYIGITDKRVLQNPNIFVSADKSKLSQVLFNIIDNAYKFTTKGRIYVIVNISESDSNDSYFGKVIVSIRDTGKEISSDIIPRLFTICHKILKWYRIRFVLI